MIRRSQLLALALCVALSDLSAQPATSTDPLIGIWSSEITFVPGLHGELDLTVVFTAENYGQGGIWGRFRDQIVPKEIIPAIIRR
jgi:hypothetical protein